MKNSNTKQNIEEQINLTMQSIEGIQRANANPFLYEKVMMRVNTPEIPSEEPGWNYNRGVKYALVMLLFIALNIATILQISRDTITVKETNKTSETTETKKESKGYFDDFINDSGYNF